MWQRHGEVVRFTVALEGVPRIFKLASYVWQDALRENRDAIPVAFPAPHDEASVLHVEVFNPKSEGFGDAESGPVEEKGDTPVHAVHLLEESAHFVARKNVWNVLGSPRTTDVLEVAEREVENALVQKDQRI